MRRFIESEEDKDMPCEGWKNYETCNVVTCIDNTKDLYFAKKDFLKDVFDHLYDDMIEALGIKNDKTIDHVAYNSKKLSKAELNEWLLDEMEEMIH